MKGLPPPAPPKIGGELLTRPQPPPYQGGELKSPLLDKEGVGGGSLVEKGVGGGCFDNSRIHNKATLKDRRKSLRNKATPAEKNLWSILQNSQLNGYKFRRQHSVGYYILDFYCPSERLAIELDGDSHFTEEAAAYDKERTFYLKALNIRVLRFLNTDVYNNVDAVGDRILAELKEPKAYHPQPLLKQEGSF
jgi:very-short-patch-repair endonuclease